MTATSNKFEEQKARQRELDASLKKVWETVQIRLVHIRILQNFNVDISSN